MKFKRLFKNAILKDLNMEKSQNKIVLDQASQTIDFGMMEFLPNPDLKDLKYTDKKIALKTNLYKIKVKKSYTLYEYSVKFQHDDPNLSTAFKAKIISKQNMEVAKNFGVFFFTGQTLFGTKELKEVVNIISVYKKVQYSILICPTKEKVEMSEIEEAIKTRPAIKHILELIIKDILRANPKLKFMKNMYTMKNEKKPVESYENSISLFPGFTTKVMLLEDGLYLNVDIRNKISSTQNCLEIIKSFMKGQSKVTQKAKDQVNCYFKDRYVELLPTGQKFKIESVNFERNANNYAINFESNFFLTF